MVKLSSEETPTSISFTPLKLLKSEVRDDGHGMFVVMEFVDSNGVRLKTPDIPYPSHFDPMSADINAEYREDEIRIKNNNGQTIMSVFASSISYDSQIPTSLNPNGHLCIEPDEGEDQLPIRRFSLSQGETSEVGFQQAFERANAERQRAQDAVYEQLNDDVPLEERQNALRTLQDMRRGQLGFTYPSGQVDVFEEHPEFKTDYKMKCSCCDGKIHYPDKMIQLLGNDGTKKYFEFCEKTGSEPQLFCCSCYGLMQRNSNIITAVNKMNGKIKSMMDLTEREEAVDKREKELDEQIKAIKK